MSILSLKDAAFVARTTLFQNLTLTLGPGDRLGLVAQNGAGKSTLLRCLAGETELSHGDVIRARGTRIGYVPQDVEPALLGQTFRDAVLSAIPKALWDSESWRVDAVLESLNAPREMRALPVSALSGGWQRLMLLARVWVTDPDALLLDEPTNYLDLEKILSLENWLEAWASHMPVVIASHDRAFLDAATNRTLFLRPEISRQFALPYSPARDALAQWDASDAAEQERDLKEAQKLRRQSAKLKNIGVNSGSDLLLKKQKQLRKRADKIEEAATALHSERSGEIRLSNRGTHAKVLVRIEDLKVTAPDGRLLFKVRELNLFKGDRIVLLGRNGTGKTTLLRLLRKALEGSDDVSGVKPTPTLVVGYMDQALSDVPVEQTPFDLMSGRGKSDRQCRSALAAAGIFYDMQSRPIEALSFGQKSRLALLALRFALPNFYLLDEPNNHVDISGQEALADEIKANGACCLLVSHDRAFVRDVATRFLVVERGELRERDSPEDYFAALSP
ncbi:MAG: ABC-F family ATP-binding cassette domain-containing protein [Pseudomonadota bacterium]